MGTKGGGISGPNGTHIGNARCSCTSGWVGWIWLSNCHVFMTITFRLAKEVQHLLSPVLCSVPASFSSIPFPFTHPLLPLICSFQLKMHRAFHENVYRGEYHSGRFLEPCVFHLAVSLVHTHTHTHTLKMHLVAFPNKNLMEQTLTCFEKPCPCGILRGERMRRGGKSEQKHFWHANFLPRLECISSHL